MKKISHISRTELNMFSEHDLDFILNQDKLKDFIGLPFSMENFSEQVKLKKNSFDQEKRNVLTEVLSEQYQHLNNNDLAINQINRLKESNTYTVTTGHQLCLLGGPMYFFLKIIHVINLSKALNKKYPNHHFVPVFWMASEDHDSAEIDHLHLFNKQIKWEHNQTGAVGRFNNEGLEDVFEHLLSLFNEERREELKVIFSTIKGENYGKAFMSWLHEIFTEHGLIIIDGDNKQLKDLFKPVMELELKEGFSNHSVQQTNEKLKLKKRKTQVHSRDINLFYLTNNERTRIIKKEHGFNIGERSFSLADLLTMLNDRADQFSPNAILRPLYQEFILPNLCYVGGMAEMNYWAQLKGVFEKTNIPYPLLQMRSNSLWLDLATNKKMEKSGLTVKDLFEDLPSLKKKFIQKNDTEPLNEEEIDQRLNQLRESIRASSSEQKNINTWIGSELKKIEKSIDQIKNKILKEKKKSHEVDLIRIEKIKESLFPNGHLQERHQNLLHFCNRNSYQSIINDLSMSIDPLNKGFTIISEQNDTK